jgi:ornithine decarboxylase
MTFDNKIELSKMAKAHPGSELVLRIKADDSSALCRLGCKFGATLPEAFSLLDTAKEMNLNVIGVSFHIGSGSSDPTAYSEAIKMARGVFHHGTSLGFNFTLLDIGGGFPGDSTSTALFTEMARSINVSLKECFADVKDLAVVAEPGRFFATSTHTLAVCVTSKKEELIDGEKVFKYYVNDGVYGSFNCVIFDHTTPRPKTVCLKNTQHFKCSVWGPTCDGLDLIVDDRVLPEVNIGDWLFFEDMGAYTMSASSTFNGFPKPCSFYYTTNPDILEECPLGNVLAQDGYHKSELMPLVLDDVYRVEQLVS